MSQNIPISPNSIKKNTVVSKNSNAQTALKLLNQYAESYYKLEHQYNLIKRENSDLRSNLEINKNIIKDFFQGTPTEKKMKNFLLKLKDENIILMNRIKELENEITNFNNRNIKEQILKEEIEQGNSKIFLLENLLKEKDSEIQRYKLIKKNKMEYEIYVSDPTPIINLLNEKAEMYKLLNGKIDEELSNIKSSLLKKEKKIKELEEINNKLREELNAIKQEKTNCSIISQLNQYKKINKLATCCSYCGNTINGYHISNKRSLSTNTYNGGSVGSNKNIYNYSVDSNKPGIHEYIFNDSDKISNSTNISGNSKSRNIINQIEHMELMNKSKKKFIDGHFDLTEEWYEALKHCNMTQEEFVKFCGIEKTQKLTDIIEYLYKLIIDKKIQVKLITEENDKLSHDNLELNKKLIEITYQLKDISSRVTGSGTNKEKLKSNENGNDNSTFVNYEENNIDAGFIMDYIKEVKQSITSSEFQEGMIIDQFDITSEMSKKDK